MGMKKPISMIACGVAMFLFSGAPATAQGKIQAVLNSKGRLVFTNLADNPPVPNTPALQESDLLAQEMPQPLRTLVDAISENHGVDPALVRAVMKTESNFNRWAVSNKGAMGLMQLIPATGKRFGVRDFFDPEQNIQGGVRYLRFLLQKFSGNIDLSLAAYNAGENLVQQLGRIPDIRETTNYVRKIRAIYKKPNLTLESAAAPQVLAAKNDRAQEEPAQIFRSVDDRGVVRFSNIEPPN